MDGLCIFKLRASQVFEGSVFKDDAEYVGKFDTEEEAREDAEATFGD